MRQSLSESYLRLAWESPWRVRRHALRLLQLPLITLRFLISGVTPGPGGRYFGMPVVQRYKGSIISIGKDVELRSSTRSNVLGVSHPVILTTLSREARIDIGDGVGISGATLCSASSITIGPGTLIGADAIITDTDHHKLSGTRSKYPLAGAACSPIVVGRNVFIGARAILLKGSSIGDCAVVGAGAVVAGHVPPRAIVAGNPAKQVGWNTETEIGDSSIQAPAMVSKAPKQSRM